MSISIRHDPSVKSISNPLDGGSLDVVKKMDNLSGTKPIQQSELDGIIQLLKKFDVNEVRLKYLEEEKAPFLFSSAHLMQLLEITPSVKTRLSMIVMIGPRLIDPRTKVDYFLGLFRFSEEKEKVQEVLKARTHVISSNLFRQPTLHLGGGGGEGFSSPASVNSETKPFLGIKGLAGARERVSKPIPRSRILTPEMIAPTVSTPVSPVSVASGPIASKWSAPAASTPVSPVSVASGPIASKWSAPAASTPVSPVSVASAPIASKWSASTVPPVTPVSVPSFPRNENTSKWSSNSVAVTPVTSTVPRNENLSKWTGSVEPSVTPGPTSARMPFVTPKAAEAASPVSHEMLPTKSASFVAVQATSVPIVKRHSLTDSEMVSSEFGSSGKVQRMIKSYSTTSVRNVLETDGPYLSPHNTGPSPKAKVLSSDAKRDRGVYELSASLFDDELHDRNKLSPFTASLEDDDPSSECTSVEESEGQDSDSVMTWRQLRNRRDVRSIAGDLNRLSFERKKLLFSANSPDHSENTTFDSNRADVAEGMERGQAMERARSPSSRRASISKKKYGSRTTRSVDPELRRRSRRDSAQAVAAAPAPVAAPSVAVTSGKVKDLTLFNTMPSEGPVGRDLEGTPLYRYYELVRMNFVKKYEGIKQSELVYSMVDSEFAEHFGMTKDEFRNQPSWRQVQRKKSLLLF